MGMNPWFTGLGLGYDPTNKRTTGNEWLVRLVQSLIGWYQNEKVKHSSAIKLSFFSRGDKAVSSGSLDAAYVVLWNKDMKAWN